MRERLNALYDAFVSKWGCFHANGNKELIMLDSLGVEVFTIEMQVGKDIFKSDIMREPTAFKVIDTDKTLTVDEESGEQPQFLRLCGYGLYHAVYRHG